MSKLLKKLFFVVVISTINIFLILTTLFFMRTIALHKRFETEPVAQAQVFAYSQRYTQLKAEFRSDLQFKTAAGQTIYLRDVAISAKEKAVLEQGNAISRDYLQNAPHIIRPMGTLKANGLMALLFGGMAIFNFVYLLYWWRKY